MLLFRAKNTEELIENAFSFNIDYKKGLTAEQVKHRKKEGLANKTKKKVTKSVWKIIFDNVINPLNILLIIIFLLMISAKLNINRYVFLVILFLNASLGFYQDIKARKLVSKLSVMNDPVTFVLRDGEEIELPNEEIVYDDIIILKVGDQVPTDCEIIEGSCTANESMLTGESDAVHKTAKDQLLSGSYITSGTVKAIVRRVGAANYVEKLQEKASAFARPQSEIKQQTTKIVYICTIFVILFAIISLVSNTVAVKVFDSEHFEYSPWIDSLSGSLISMIPSGMYLLTSLTLTIGVISLAKKRMLVQELYCIEMLARVDMICFDKTGTLTEDKMKVDEVVSTSSLNLEQIYQIVCDVVVGTKDDNATNSAIKDFLGKKHSCEKIARYIPFNSANKFSAVELESGMTYAIGAYGFVQSKQNNEIEELVLQKSREGYRVICIYENKKPFENGFMAPFSSIVGIILLSNAVKPDAAENIKWFQDNDVKVKIISGDNALTVSHIAKVCGVKDYDKFVNCEDITDEDLVKLAEENAVFGRVSPEQKELLIKTFKSHGHTVAMTGDGVNDILALKKADCSIAMSNGSSAARNVAHIVSLDNDFSKLPDVVKEGRRVINNLQRSCSLFLSKTIFAILLTLVFDVLFIFYQINYPFTTSNMMIWELVTIGFASFMLALQPSNERLVGSFAKNIFVNAIPSGIAEALTVILAFLLTRSCQESFVTMAVLSFTIMSAIVLLKICVPLDLYRIFAYLVCLVAAVGIVIIDQKLINLLSIDWKLIDFKMFVLICGIEIVCTFVYLVGHYYVNKKLLKENVAR